MKIVPASMRRPVTVSMITLAALIFGAVSLSRLPLNLLPDISYPTLTIQTEYPDAAPAEVEKLITEPLEEAVSVVPGLRNLRSVSRAGVSEITLEFAWKTAMDYASLDVREKLDLVNLPDDAGSPVLLRFDPAMDPILRVGLYGDRELSAQRHLAERIVKKDLESLEGVASVRVQGGLEEEIHVEVDEARLSALGVPMSAVSQFLSSQNINAAGGRLRDRDADFLVRTLNEFESIDDIRQTIVYEGAGRRVKLEDVATITRGFKEREIVSRVHGKESVELALYKEGNANTVQVARTVKRRLNQLDEILPDDVDTEILFDQSTFIEHSLAEVRSNALVGGLLAVFILFLFLKDRRSTAIVATVIPVSILATFFVMQQLDVTLNIMSLGGLALGVGMLVDNAIVVLEAISRHRAQGAGVWEATCEGASEVSQAVTASTLTTVAVFLPIIFVEGIAGQIFRDQALTVTASLMVSLVAALTLIPVLASLGSRRREAAAAPAVPGTTERETAAPGPPAARRRREPGRLRRRLAPVGRVLGRPLRLLGWPLRFLGRGVSWLLRWAGRSLFILLPGGLLRVLRFAWRALIWISDLLMRPLHAVFDRGWSALASTYPRLLRSALRHRAATVVLAFILAAAAALLVPGLGVELVPPFSQGQFAFELELPPGTPLSACEEHVAAIERELAGDPRIGLLFTSVGESPELGSASAQRRENVARLNVTITDPADHVMEAAVIAKVRRLLARRPEIRYNFRRPSYFSFQTPVEVQVYGYDIDQTRLTADALAAAMARIPGLRDVSNSLEAGSPELQVEFSRDRMAAMGLDIETVARLLRGKIHGDVATRLKEQDRQIDIRVRSAQASEMDAEQVRSLVVNQVDGIPVPLSTVADVTLGRGPAQITHIGQQRAAVVSANLVGRDLGSATHDIETMLAAFPIPATMAVTLGGQNLEVSTSFRSLLLAVCLAIFMVYLVMASQFESFLHPFVILMTVPLGLVGTIFALAVTGTVISVVVLIGAVMLTGIVVNNAIVLVDFVNQRRRAGLPKREAILDAAQARLRPIFMTTLTTVLGLLPMAIGLGEGAEIRAPMAIAVIGGLILATLLTLVVIPVVYDLLDRRE
ncbi:MAG: efflux RND transporter permease subunit [Candidatus Krumholzibacteriota bacterium]|nr:efflux RND transporter permease subunit [Candidatus Krumholzibacteriota bacterium]